MSQLSGLGTRRWFSHAAITAVIISALFVGTVPANGQAMPDMPGMEHHHYHGAAASQQKQPAASTPHTKPRSSGMNRARGHRSPHAAKRVQHVMPGMQHGQHGLGAMPGMQHGGHGVGAMPGMEHGEHGMQHGEHGMEGMHMQGQFGPYAMSREASGTAWQPDSTPHQGVMFMSGEWMLMGTPTCSASMTTRAGRAAAARPSHRAW